MKYVTKCSCKVSRVFYTESFVILERSLNICTKILLKFYRKVNTFTFQDIFAILYKSMHVCTEVKFTLK